MLAIGAILVIGVIVGSTSSRRPAADPDLVVFASGLGDQLGWTEKPVDQTAGLASEGSAIGSVTVVAPSGIVEFRRWPDIATRTASQPAGDATVAGCAAITVSFAYEDKEVAASEALTATNLLRYLNGGDCETVSQTVTTRASIESSPRVGEKPYDLAMDSCTPDQFGFVTAKGTVRNNGSSERSYFVEITIVNSEDVRIGYGNGFATAVDPGQTATWSVIGTVDYSGAVTCKYSAEEL